MWWLSETWLESRVVDNQQPLFCDQNNNKGDAVKSGFTAWTGGWNYDNCKENTYNWERIAVSNRIKAKLYADNAGQTSFS